MTYWDPATNDICDINKDNRTMVRVNCKFDPNDTKIKFPPYMKTWRKTTMDPTRDDGGWILIEDRVDMYDINEEVEHCDRLCIFAQAPKISSEGACYCCVPLDLGDHKLTTMGHKNRSKYEQGIKDVVNGDNILQACVTKSRCFMALGTALYF